MGDFNQLPIKLSNYYQIIKKPTRNNKILDKCFTKVKNGYSHCHQLAKLGRSDHYVMHLVPSYKPLSKTKPAYVTRRRYTDENCEALQASLDITLWDNLLDNACIDKQTEVISDYINFCTDLCIPKKTVKKHANQKPWIKKHIDDLIDQKQDAHQKGKRKLYHKLKKLVSKEIKKSKEEYSKNIQQHLIKEPARAWKDIKKLNGLPTSTSIPLTMKYHSNQMISTPSSRATRNLTLTSQLLMKAK